MMALPRALLLVSLVLAPPVCAGEGDYAPVDLWRAIGLICRTLTLAGFILAGMAGQARAAATAGDNRQLRLSCAGAP